MSTQTIYLRVEPKIKEFFVKRAKADDRPMNYFLAKILADYVAKETVVEPKKTVVRKKKVSNETQVNNNNK